MYKAKDVFDNPSEYWDFLTLDSDSQFEGQHFDRKEAGRLNDSGNLGSNQLNKLADLVTECVSGFANGSVSGGLLVLGISSRGKVTGINHLSEAQISRLVDVNNLLLNQATQVKVSNCQDQNLNPNKIALLYTPHNEKAICQTPGKIPKAWKRQGPSNIPLNHEQIEQLKREKKITDFERGYCCPYDPEDLDRGVLKEFRQVSLSDAIYEWSDEKLLHHAGALIREDDKYIFTNAGFLFFTFNPQRIMPWSYIRLLRFETKQTDSQNLNLPTLEKSFGGSLSQQIRNLRTFFRESGLFKLYQKRDINGGFIEEPEYPYIAIDEAIVNAVAHRDYAMKLPIECEYYLDAFLVRNSGCLIQRDRDVPDRFSLAQTTLVSMPRNSLLIEWLKKMRRSNGQAFVRALSEGTRRMRDEMLNLGLPAPEYKISPAQTRVVLSSKAEEREAAFQGSLAQPSTEFTNLFPLRITSSSDRLFEPKFLHNRRKDLLTTLRDSLQAKGWYIDSSSFNRLIAHKKGGEISQAHNISGTVRFYPAYSFQIRQYEDRYYLCIDYRLEVRNVLNLAKVLNYLPPQDLVGKQAIFNWQGWQRGKIKSASSEYSTIFLFDFQKEEFIASDKIIPNLSTDLIEKLLQSQSINFNLPQAIKKHSLAAQPNAARTRVDKTMAVAHELSTAIFSLRFDDLYLELEPYPVKLHKQNNSNSSFVVKSLPEPNVEFGHHQESPDIRTGITQFGAYTSESKKLEIVPFVDAQLRIKMANLIERLKTGKYKYKGSERTFKTRFSYSSIVTTTSPDNILSECQRILSEHPDWIGDRGLSRLFLIHIPEQVYALDDESSPYYRVKRFLLEKGIPCQMLDTSTLNNPDWKDLNLALDIVSKCGVTPWVLPDAMPDADFFIGLSYTQNGRRGSERLMGYANVFNQYGKWEFYSGNTETFPYSERVQKFQLLTQQTLERLSLGETPHIYFHYSAKFSREDRAAILAAARQVRPEGTYSFVWINSHHQIRLYDSRVETDGSLSRGSYMIGSSNQIYLSTTGYNPYRKALGTPKPLEITIWTEPPPEKPKANPDLKALAVQILSLTKLNWASTDSLCGKPITTKYARDIAYLTDAFIRQNQSFNLHPVLEETPWFL